MQHKP